MKQQNIQQAISCFNTIPHLSYGHYPTPIEELPRLREALAQESGRFPRILIKRDDYTGPGFGGNKVRKLEYALAEAVADGAEVAITSGGVKSNHARVTAAMCARLGLRCVLVLNSAAVMYEGLNPASLSVDEMFGAEIVRVGKREERAPAVEAVAEKLRSEGRKVAVIPIGASIPLGALGYVRAVQEAKAQLEAMDVKIDYVFHSSSSGGTQAGIVAGCQLFDWREVKIIGVSPDDSSASISEEVGRIICGIGEVLGAELEESVTVLDEYVGDGYGIPSAQGDEATELLARAEGVVLDPVYTAKAMAALIDWIRKGKLGEKETVLFWHTGGQLALFYAPAMSDKLQFVVDSPIGPMREPRQTEVCRTFSYEVVAKNYGADHANKIHSDEGAAKYGFAGALVPGVGVYAYLTRPVVDALGRQWIERGSMAAKFIKPVYDGEKVRAQATISNVDPIELKLELLNSSGVVCAVGSAGLPNSLAAIDPRRYPLLALPRSDQLLPATIASFSIGEALGSLDFTLDLQGRVAQFLDDVVESSPIYRDAGAVCHPAFWIAQANEILVRNIALGPWIHTSSETRHYTIAGDGEKLSLRGRVIDLHEKRGHEFVVADLAMFGENERPIARIEHTAIIRLREAG